jgi:hypothetical protein
VVTYYVVEVSISYVVVGQALGEPAPSVGQFFSFTEEPSISVGK